jgi:hypothetical protein
MGVFIFGAPRFVCPPYPLACPASRPETGAPCRGQVIVKHGGSASFFEKKEAKKLLLIWAVLVSHATGLRSKNFLRRFF